MIVEGFYSGLISKIITEIIMQAIAKNGNALMRKMLKSS
jgi:hypothetical protein